MSTQPADKWSAMIPDPHPQVNCGPLQLALAPGQICPTCGTIIPLPREGEIYERAKDRNQGREPDDLHLAYETEMTRLRLDVDAALNVVTQWTAGTEGAASYRQRNIRASWPALADALDALRAVVRS